MKRLISATLLMLVFFSSRMVWAGAPPVPGISAPTLVTSTSFTANWQSSTGATSYSLDVGTNSATPTSVINNSNKGNVLSFSVTGLSPNTTYYYQVSATTSGGGGGTSAFSTQQSVRTAPAAPANPAASSITATSFTAGWSAATGATAYFLDVGTTSGGTDIQNNLAVGNVTSYSVTGLSAGSTYYFRVRASNGNPSPNSASVTVGTVPPAPVIDSNSPSAVGVSPNYDTSFIARWNASASATGYYIDVAKDSAFSTMVVTNQTTTGFTSSGTGPVIISYTVGSLTGGTQYYYRVRAYNASGTSATSGWGGQVTLPSAPTAAAANGYLTDGSGFTANWSAPTGAIGYSYDVSTNSGFTAILAGYNNAFVATNSAAIIGLTPGTTYYYRVRAIDTAGTNPTNSGTITALTIPAAPVPSGRTTATGTSVVVTWAAATSATGYYLDVATDSGFTSMLSGFNNLNVGNVTSYTVTGVTPGTDYYYRVRAYNTSGTGSSSSSQYVDFTNPVLVSLTVGTNSTDPNAVLLNGTSFNGGPYIRSATPYLTATFSEPVYGIQYSTNNQGITLKNSAASIVSLAAGFVPANSTTAATVATFQPASALPTTTCATSKYSINFSGGNSSNTLIHDAMYATATSDNALTSVGPLYFTVDTTNPTVSSVSPASGTTGVAINQAVTVVFTENCSMDYTAYTPTNVQLTNSDGKLIPTTISWSPSSPYTTLTISPSVNLDYNTTYTLALSNIKDAAGNPLGGTGSYTSTFTTGMLSATAYDAVPSFISAPVTPNVLIILDNSNSMDETLNTGDGIGSFNCTDSNNLNTCSRSVLARQALINLINTYAGKINIGLMSYYVPDGTSKNYYLYNNFYFVSYDPRTYCGIIPPPAACFNYCVGEASPQQTACNNACQGKDPNYTGTFNANFDASIRDAIVSGTTDSNGSAPNGAKRKNYCSTVYPKTVAYNYTDNAGHTGTLYHSIVGTFYTTSSTQGTRFLNAESPQGKENYSTNESHTTSSNYYYYQNKVTPNAPPYNTGYSSPSTNSAFGGTDDDLAMGFLNYGQSNMFYPPYGGAAAPTWSSSSYTVSGGMTGGFLHVPAAVNDPNKTGDNTQLNALLAKLGASGFKNDAGSYMACSSSGAAANRCSYIVNAGATPTASTLQSAIDYFKGGLVAGRTQANSAPATPIKYPCQKTFVIYVTDGLPSVDNGSGSVTDATSLVTGKDSSGASVTVPGGTVLDKLNLLRCPSNPTVANCGVSNTINGATVKTDVQTYILGLSITPLSQSLLDQMAVAGGTATSAGKAYYANDPTALNNALITIFQNIMSQLSAGTAASILNNSEGSGANMLQAVFYPNKTFDSNSQCSWIGEMQNLWYFVDPTLNNSTIREDSNNDVDLNLKLDKIARFYFDNAQNKTLVNIFTDADGNGTADSSTPDATVAPDYVKSLWKAGVLLWKRDISADPRTIYTGLFSTAGATPNVLSSALFNTTQNLDLLQIPATLTLGQRQTKAGTLLNWVYGTDQASDADGTSYRSRKITMSTCSNDPSLRCSLNSDCLINGVSGTCTSLNREWRLGDIISSTPRVVSNQRQNAYDIQAPGGYGDLSYAGFTSTATYKTRGMAFVGSNDGMLHAFKMGTLNELTGRYDKANITGTNLGREEWAFVPQSALPYLTYLTSPSYQHMYLVDKTPTVTDASIAVPSGCGTDYSTCPKDATTWRTVLIGGMGLGGAAKADTDSCSAPANCVKTPAADPRLPGYGLSSYFALDVSDPEAPKYLWEFNGDPANGNYLGYSTTGPAIVRVAAKDSLGNPDHSKNGKWFAVFASGPTGPIDTTNQLFKGQSDQSLKLFIVDLANGTLVKTIDTGITNAFAGALSSNVIDIDRSDATSAGFYSDDAVYIGYTQADTSVTPNTWTKGGVIRLFTQESSDPASSDPTKQWKWSTLINGIGPVTTAVSKLQDRANKNLWIYFGTGRYYFKADDPSSTQKLYGVKEPCYSKTTPNKFSTSCTDTVTSSTTTSCSTVGGGATGLCDQSGSTSTSPSPTLDGTMAGWFVTLDAAGGSSNAERVITDPVALTNGNVFFTTFKPASDACAFGGNALIWALNYNTGAAPVQTTMQGTALMQSSTGAFAELPLATAFSNPGDNRLNYRRSSQTIQGVPPSQQGLVLVKNPTPVKKLLHIREK